MATVLYDGFYITEDPTAHIGPSNWTSSTPVNDYQKYNSLQIYKYLKKYGFTINAVSGMLGCFQKESYINPSLVQSSPYTTLQSNDVMNSYTSGIGLAQWTDSSAPPQKYVQYCIDNGLIWYSGKAACSRMIYQYNNDKQFAHYTIQGTAWTWYNYYNSTEDAATLAYVWNRCYQRSSATGEDIVIRQENARQWYTWLQNNKPIPLWLLLWKSQQRRFNR